MRGLIFMFLMLVFLGITWRYTPKADKRNIKLFISSNIFVVAVSAAAVAVAVFFSINTTLRLV